MSEKRPPMKAEYCFRSDIKPTSTPQTNISQYKHGDQTLAINRAREKVQLDTQSVLHIEKINDTFVTWYVTLGEHVITTMAPWISNTQAQKTLVNGYLNAQAYDINGCGYFVYLNKENNTLVETKYVFRFLKRQKNDTVTIKVTKFSKPHKETIPNSIMKTSETINVVLPKARDENPNHFPESIPLFSNGRHTIYLAYNGYNGPHHKTYEFGLYVKSTNGRWAAFQVFQASLKKDNPEWKHLHTKLEGHIRLRKDIPQSVKLIANSALPATDRNTQPLELNFQLNSADERIAAMTIWNAKPENCT
ncbi:MAG: hypothetical protein J7K00_03080 [Candidatus Diapherotrites archaeon]|nr:hypothetical protein [Candidatus Diapherotrites archaeon]